MEWELASVVTMILAGMAATLSCANGDRTVRVPVQRGRTGELRNSASKHPAA